MKRKLIWALALLFLLLAAAPFWNADRFAPRIQAGLERALGRKVDTGAVRLHFLTGPGFSVRKVVIHERPEISAEPFAYVDDLVIRIRLLSLLSGKLEFSSLRLDKPHVNLMRQADGAWNIQTLLAPPGGSPAGGAGTGAPIPELEVRRGRLNFKIDDRKSAYYFNDAAIDVSAVGGGNFDIWFVGEMARTDRMARGLGRVTARGRLRDTGAEPKLNLDVQLERSALQELAQLVGTHDLGVHGVVTSRAEISGPVSSLRIKGQLDLTELHHWTHPPRDAAVNVAYTGLLELSAQTLRLETDQKRPLRFKVELDKFLTQPQWRVDAAATELTLQSMEEWLRPPGSDFDAMHLAGTLDGELHASSDQPATGSASLKELDWSWGEAARLEAASLTGEWKDGILRLAPAPMTLDGQPLQVDCEWAFNQLAWECRGSSKGHDVKKLQRWMKALGLRAEWVENLTGGQARGALTVAQKGMEPLLWRGQLELRNAELRVPELSAPVKIASAGVSWQQDRLSIPNLRATTSGIEWTGSYRYAAGSPRPHRLTVQTDTLELEDLERILRPIWKGSGFFSRALGIGDRKESGPAEITLLAEELGLIRNLRATVWREGDRVTISSAEGEWRNGTIKSSGTVRLGGDLNLSGTLSGLGWEGGTVNADWQLSGRNRLTLQGSAKMAGGPADSVSGKFKWQSPGRLSLTALEGQIDGRKVAGKVSGPADGAQIIEFGDALRLRAIPQPFSVTIDER